MLQTMNGTVSNRFGCRATAHPAGGACFSWAEIMLKAAPGGACVAASSPERAAVRQDRCRAAHHASDSDAGHRAGPVGWLRGALLGRDRDRRRSAGCASRIVWSRFREDFPRRAKPAMRQHRFGPNASRAMNGRQGGYRPPVLEHHPFGVRRSIHPVSPDHRTPPVRPVLSARQRAEPHNKRDRLVPLGPSYPVRASPRDNSALPS